MTFDEELMLAWADLTPPPRSAITAHNCPECDEVVEFFGGKSWMDVVDVDALRYHHEALHRFAPLAYRYYLAAFMRATFLDPQAADHIADTIASSIMQEWDWRRAAD